MIVLNVICRARVHDAPDARAAGCVCPINWATPYRLPKPPQRRYVPGHRSPGSGPHRSAPFDPDGVAVERAAGGDRTVRLAPAELDAAIDALDRRRYSAREVAMRLGITMRTVQRRRAARRAEVAS